MKAIKFKLNVASLLFYVMLFTALSLSAQNGPGPYGQRHGLEHGKGNGFRQGKGALEGHLDLTDDQKAKIESSHTTHKKEMLPLKASLMEKMARLNSLQISDNPDMNAINKTIEEIGEIKTKTNKSQVAHRMEIRKILTDEQRVTFDEHMLKRGNRPGAHYFKKQR